MPEKCQFAVLLMFSLALSVPAVSAEPKNKPGKSASPSDDKPICTVTITPRDGLPSTGTLLSYGDGVYVVKYSDGRRYEVQEATIKSVEFSPLKKPHIPRKSGRPDKRPTLPEHSERKPPRHRPQPGRWGEIYKIGQQFSAMKKNGTLKAHIKKAEESLKIATDIVAARDTFRKLLHAHRAQSGGIDRPLITRILGSIRDQEVRRQLQHQLPQIIRPFMQSGLRRGPR